MLELTRTLLEIRALAAVGVQGIVVASEILAAGVDERALFRAKLSGTVPDPQKVEDVAAALVPAKIILATALHTLVPARGVPTVAVAPLGLRSAADPADDPLALTEAVLALPLDATVPHEAVAAAVNEMAHAQSGTAPSVGEAMGIKAAGDLVAQVKNAGPSDADKAAAEAAADAERKKVEAADVAAAQRDAENLRSATLDPGYQPQPPAFDPFPNRAPVPGEVVQPGTTVG